MRGLIIRALNEKGKEVMQTKGEQSRMGNFALKVVGIQERITSKEPYTIMVLMKKPVPDPVIDQMIFALQKKFEDLGAVIGEDLKIERGVKTE